jgi:peptide/nickel transport system permease protein
VIGYILRRLGTAVIVVLLITLITFWLLHVIAPSPARDVLGLKATPAAVAAWNKKYGYDSSFWVQYGHYLWKLLHGNLGYDYFNYQPVTHIFAEYAPRSAFLTGASLVLAIIIAIPLGIYQAARRSGIGDIAVTSAAFTTYSMPTFFLGFILIDIFAFSLNWLPSEASQEQSLGGILGDPSGLVLPIATLTLVTVASYSRYMRSSALDSLAQDYIRLARAKGLSERAVLFRHLLRNACLPMVTLVGLSIPLLLAGNLVTEVVFNFRGIGYLFDQSLGNYDFPVLLAYTLIAGILTVIGNLIADVSLSVADPRIRITG